MTLETGHQLQQGRYLIRELLGRGGMGTVYLAADRNLPGRLVAIKENTDTAPATQEQFQAEAILLARLTHPNLPRVTDHFIEPSGRQYLVMDYVEGDDLRTLLRANQGPLPEAVVLQWLDQVLSALTYMHNWIDPTTRQQTPIIHRDIKPGNIKRTPNGRIVLVDFGVAKVDETTKSSEGTEVGARAFTPGYAPLEQYSGGTDARADIYALGATLYNLLTGERPPEAPALAAGTPLIPPRQHNPQVSRALEHIILRAMALQAADRYQRIEEMHAALHQRRPPEPVAPRAAAPRADANNRPIAPHLTLTHMPTPQPRRAYWLSLSAMAILALLVIALLSMPTTWLARWRSAATLPSTPAQVAVGTLVATATDPMPQIVVSLDATATTAPTLPPTPTQTPTLPPTATPILSPSPSPSLSSSPTATAPPSPTPAATATPMAGAQRTHDPDGAVYRFVPAGPFTMGSAMVADELPVHTVMLDAFWIMETEVTNALYAQCVAAGACTAPTNTFWTESTLATHPVTDVDWAQASAYATWVAGRLPTEAEWEKAARGTDERLFPWAGESTDADKLNFLSTSTTPVGSFVAGASPFGVLDLAGNVEEWVADWYSPDYYASAPAANPPGPATGLMRVVRGGSFNSNRGNVRTTARGRALPDAHFPSIGFRVVLPAP